MKIRLAGLGGHTMTPRFHLTSEGLSGGTGVRVDNVQIQQVTLSCLPCIATDVSPALAGKVIELAIDGPNPSPAGVRVRYSLPERTRVRIELFDVRGRRVSVLADGEQAAGSRTLKVRNGQRALSPGVYFVRLQAGKATRTLRLVSLE